LVTVKKRVGGTEEFSKAKLKASLKKSGAKEEHATKVTEVVAGKVKEGVTSTEIKGMAAAELKKMDAAAAKKYEAFKKPSK
jgi:transcriptional regulator NrdR family protein